MLQVFFAVFSYGLCFGVEGEEFKGRDKKFIIFLDPVGNGSERGHAQTCGDCKKRRIEINSHR